MDFRSVVRSEHFAYDEKTQRQNFFSRSTLMFAFLNLGAGEVLSLPFLWAFLSSPFIALGFYFGRAKNRGAEGAALGFLLGPLGTVVIYFLPPRLKRSCPLCFAGVHEKATVCPHCRSAIDP